MIRTVLLTAAFAATCMCAAPLRADNQSLEVGKHASSATFPCKPQRQRQQVAETEVGAIYFTSLMCSQGNNAYLLGVTEYPKEVARALSVEEMLDSTLDDARSKPFMKIRSSSRTTRNGLPAIRSHLLDTRKPKTETVSEAILADGHMIVAQVTAPAGSAQSRASADFLASLKIAQKKSAARHP
ncbi:MAG TPA: hypothetical protein VGD18_06640 [Thiobacillaceae bacterium]